MALRGHFWDIPYFIYLSYQLHLTLYLFALYLLNIFVRLSINQSNTGFTRGGVIFRCGRETYTVHCLRGSSGKSFTNLLLDK